MCSMKRVCQFCYNGTYWVPDFPDIKGFAGHLWHSILIFANGASSAWSCKHIYVLGQVCGLVKCSSRLRSPKILKSSWRGLEKSELPWEPILYSHKCVACRTISLPSFNSLCCKLTEIVLFIYLMLWWVEWMTSSVLPFAYFTHFSNSNIPGPMQIFPNGKQRF